MRHLHTPKELNFKMRLRSKQGLSKGLYNTVGLSSNHSIVSDAHQQRIFTLELIFDKYTSKAKNTTTAGLAPVIVYR